MSEPRATYSTPAQIVNPDNNPVCINCPIVAQLQERIAILLGPPPGAGLANPAYHAESLTQRLARLGVEMAHLQRLSHGGPMSVESINVLIERMETIGAEILTLSENWEPSNE